MKLPVFGVYARTFKTVFVEKPLQLLMVCWPFILLGAINQYLFSDLLSDFQYVSSDAAPYLMAAKWLEFAVFYLCLFVISSLVFLAIANVVVFNKRNIDLFLPLKIFGQLGRSLGSAILVFLVILLWKTLVGLIAALVSAIPFYINSSESLATFLAPLTVILLMVFVFYLFLRYMFVPLTAALEGWKGHWRKGLSLTKGNRVRIFLVILLIAPFYALFMGEIFLTFLATGGEVESLSAKDILAIFANMSSAMTIIYWIASIIFSAVFYALFAEIYLVLKQNAAETAQVAG